MPILTLEIPDAVFSTRRKCPDDFLHDLRLAAAMQWYQRGEISQEKAAQVAGLDARR